MYVWTQRHPANQTEGQSSLQNTRLSQSLQTMNYPKQVSTRLSSGMVPGKWNDHLPLDLQYSNHAQHWAKECPGVLVHHVPLDLEPYSRGEHRTIKSPVH